MKLTQARLKELLQYNPETGEFTWLVRRGRALVGMQAGCVHHDGYRAICIEGRLYTDSRLAWLYIHGYFPKEAMDHINRDKLDCRFINLRTATVTQSLANRKTMKTSQTGFKGVQKSSRYRWMARISIDNKLVYLGMFDTPEEAHAAYCKAGVKLHGKYFYKG